MFARVVICSLHLTSQCFVQAILKYGDVDIFTSNYRPLKATLSGLPDRVFMKLIVCARTNKVLGLHMCGEDSAEIVQVAVHSLSNYYFSLKEFTNMSL